MDTPKIELNDEPLANWLANIFIGKEVEGDDKDGL